MEARIRSATLASLMLLYALVPPAAPSSCPRPSAADAVLGPPEGWCQAVDRDPIGVVQGDEAALQRTLNLVHTKGADYVAMLFYASWCPFSKLCHPNFNDLSYMFPSIPHFSFDESVIRPSILATYGVHGFPTLFLLNSTMRVRYRGSRTINSLVAFYNDVTGVKPTLDLDFIEIFSNPLDPSELKKKDEDEPENCPFSWARSPEKLLQQDAYLALASSFVLMRLLYLLLPKLTACIKVAWRRHLRYTTVMSFWDHSQAYLEQATQGLDRLNRSKRRNLQEGAMNATAWASTSLASVSIGDTSSGRTHLAGERR